MDQINVRPEIVAAMKKAIIATLKQNKKSQTANTCAYRSEAGCCIVGHMISNGFYEESLEGSSAATVEVVKAVADSLHIDNEFVHRDEVGVMRSLQKIHDYSRDRSDNFNFDMVETAFERYFCPNFDRMDVFAANLFLDTFCEYMISEEI